MPRTRPVLLLAAAMFAVAACRSASPPATAPVMSEEEMTRRYMEYATPGPAHRLLDERIGAWDFSAKFWSPGSPEAMEASGTSVVSWILDGHYIEDRTTASSPMGPFTGLGTMGFDNLARKYVATWIDSMSTGFAQSIGEYDPATQSFRFFGKQPDPMSGGQIQVRSLEKRIDADTRSMEAWMPGPDGADFKMMEIRYTRRK